MSWHVPREWPGRTAFVIGGGPSISALGHDRLIRRLEGRHPVIAINNAYLLAPWADVLYWADNYWLADNWKDVHRHIGWYKITRQAPRLRDVTRSCVPRWLPEIAVVNCRPQAGISFDPTVIFGRNGGHNALNLAVLFGATRIVLIGFDLDDNARRQHWHDLHTRPPRTESYVQWRADFAEAADMLNARGIKVLNANPRSRLTCFPFVDLADAIEQ